MCSKAAAFSAAVLLAALCSSPLAAATATATAAAAEGAFSLHLLNSSFAAQRGAFCLDGSPPGFYFRRGLGEGARKFKIHLQGGGWCESVEDCHERAGTNLGSSTFWSPRPTTTNDGPDKNVGLYGLLGNDTNNVLANYSSVFVRYCDGSSYASHREQPVDYQGSKVYFRGQQVLQALFDELMITFDMAHAEEVILSGTSAGGLAVYMHSNFFRKNLSPSTHLVAMPDAGMFLDYPDVTGRRRSRESFTSGVAAWFDSPAAATGSDEACLQHYANETWRCWFGQYVMPFSKVPTFAVNSLYDPANYGITLGLNCGHNLTTCNSSDLAIAQKYRDVMEDVFKATVLAASPDNVVFGTACNQHEETCRIRDYEDIVIDNTSMQAAFAAWLGQQRAAWAGREGAGATAGATASFFDVRWPNNPSCWITDTAPGHGSC